MKFATRKAQDITPQDLAQRLYDVIDDPAGRAKALELLKSANPETIADAELRGVLGALVLVARGDDPPTSSEVRSTATVARSELQRLFGALDEADRLLRDFRDVRSARALDARKIARNTAGDPIRPAAAQAARNAREVEIGASVQYDGTVPPLPVDPPPPPPPPPPPIPIPSVEQVRQAMLAGFVDRNIFPFDATGLRYFESIPGQQQIRAFGLVGDAGLSDEASLLLPVDFPPAIFFDGPIRILQFNQNIGAVGTREFVRLKPATIQAQFAQGLRFEPFRRPFLDVRFSPPPPPVIVQPPPEPPLFDDPTIPPRDDFARKHLDILRGELRALIAALD